MHPQPSQSTVRTFAAVTSLALALCAEAIGGTLTANPNVVVTETNVTSPIDPTFQVVPVASDHGKLFGIGTFSHNGGNGAIDIGINGTFSALTGEVFRVDYDFTLTLTGTGTVTYSLQGAATVPLLGTLTTNPATGGPITAGTQRFTGFVVTSPAPFGVSGTFTGNLAVTWNGATANDTLSIDIPQNSIDFTVAPPIPEPSILAILGLGSVMVLGRRRR